MTEAERLLNQMNDVIGKAWLPSPMHHEYIRLSRLLRQELRPEPERKMIASLRTAMEQAGGTFDPSMLDMTVNGLIRNLAPNGVRFHYEASDLV